MSSNGNGHVVDCDSDQNGCMIIYFEGKIMENGFNFKISLSFLIFLDSGMPRHRADCSVVAEETPEEERFCKYDPEYPTYSKCYCRGDLCNTYYV